MTSPSLVSINKQIEQYKETYELLISDEPRLDLATFLNDTFRKNLLVSCASHFEDEIKSIIENFISQKTDNEMILNFVKAKAIERQYHTYFDWKGKSANTFYGFFGPEFKAKILKYKKENDDFKQQEKAFLEIGAERNLLVHDNFTDYQLNKSVEEIIHLFQYAEKYIEYLKTVIK